MEEIMYAMWLECLSNGPGVKVNFISPEDCEGGKSLDEMFAEIDWETDLEMLRMFA